MLTRIITAVVALAVLLPVLYFSDTVAFAALMALCALVAVIEMLRCTGLLGKWGVTVPALAAAAILPALPYWLSRGEMEKVGVLVLIGGTLYLFALMTFFGEHLVLADTATASMTVFYIIAAFTCMSLLRYGTPSGQYVYLICFIGAWVTDTFAYFTGRLFGRHKLIPLVSPKKTVEGSIGGTVFCVGAMVLYGLIVNRVTDGTLSADYVVLAVSGLAISVVSQLGDLLMSAIKRTYGIKDYGKLFPGHGGVLDRFDSVMAVAMVLYIITALTGLFTVS